MPEIYGEVPLKAPTWMDAPWFMPTVAALVVIFIVAILLLIKRWRDNRRERAYQHPLNVLRRKLELLKSRTDKPNRKFFGDLSSVMREAISMSLKMEAAPLTVAELEKVLPAIDDTKRANGALEVLRACESALFSGHMPADAGALYSDAENACKKLLPNAFGTHGDGGIVK